MAEETKFTPIETQEQFDQAIAARLKRERNTLQTRYEGWTSPEDLQGIRSGYEEQIGQLQSDLKQQRETIAQRDQTIAAYESASVKTRVALAAGLPYEAAGRLVGSTEEELRNDAENLKGMFAARTERPLQPGRSAEPAEGGGNDTRDMLRTVVSNLNLTTGGI